MHDTPVGLVYDWYRGVDHRGHEYLITVWDNGEAWIQTRETPADSFGRPAVCQAVGGHRLYNES